MSLKQRNPESDDRATFDMKENWLAPRAACPLAECGASVIARARTNALRAQGTARAQSPVLHALRPQTTIAAAAVEHWFDSVEMIRRSPKSEEPAGVAGLVARKPSHAFTGHFLHDDILIAGAGDADFKHRRVAPSVPFHPDFFVPDDTPPPRRVEAGSP